MKVAAILAVLAATAQAHPNFNYNAAADPCSKNRMRACHDDDTCVFTLKPRNALMGKAERNTYGHHSGPAGKGGSCAARHIYDRVNQMTSSDKKDMLEKHSLHSEWAEVQCEEAFFLKDCKDVSQAGTNKCSWTCMADDGTGGCAASEDGTSHYESCKPAVPEDVCSGSIGESINGDWGGDGWNVGEDFSKSFYEVEDNCCVFAKYAKDGPEPLMGMELKDICESYSFAWDEDAIGHPKPGGDPATAEGRRIKSICNIPECKPEGPAPRVRLDPNGGRDYSEEQKETTIIK